MYICYFRDIKMATKNSSGTYSVKAYNVKSF